jgi:hypothetical protein
MRNIRLGNGNRSVLWRWQVVSGVALALCLSACAGSSETPGVAITTDQNGAIVRVSDPDHIMAPLPTNDENVFDKSGCTHIQWCSLPGTNGLIVCATNDKPCSNDARWNECFSDARFVCGRTDQIEFSPPIPCPITGVC